MRDDELRQGERGKEVEIEELAGVVAVCEEGRFIAALSGIVDQDIDSAKTFECGIDNAGAISGVGDVAGGDECLAGGVRWTSGQSTKARPSGVRRLARRLRRCRGRHL